MVQVPPEYCCEPATDGPPTSAQLQPAGQLKVLVAFVLVAVWAGVGAVAVDVPIGTMLEGVAVAIGTMLVGIEVAVLVPFAGAVGRVVAVAVVDGPLPVPTAVP